MSHRPSALVFALAGAASAQPPAVHLDTSASGMPSGTSGILLFTDSHVQVSMSARIDPPVGTTITYTSPSGPAVGTVAGLGYIWVDLDACNAAPGQWTLSGAGFQGTTGTTWGLRSGWSLGSPGTPQTDGSLDNIQAGQFVIPGATANATNPVVEIWRGKWTPSQILPAHHTRFMTRFIDAGVYLRTGTLPSGDPIYTTVHARIVPGSAHFICDLGSPPPCFPGFPRAVSSQSVAAGRAAEFTIADLWPQGGCQWGFQWRRNCIPLVNGGNISGADSPVLRIDPVTPGDSGIYDVGVAGMRSSHALLDVLCYPNCDGSTSYPALSANDFQCFINQFAAAGNYANCDGIGGLTANDFQCFVNRYAAGCT